MIGPDGDVFLYIQLAIHVYVAKNEEESHRLRPAMDVYCEEEIEEDVKGRGWSGMLGEWIECVECVLSLYVQGDELQ
jgi:hypothetical protein